MCCFSTAPLGIKSTCMWQDPWIPCWTKRVHIWNHMKRRPEFFMACKRTLSRETRLGPMPLKHSPPPTPRDETWWSFTGDTKEGQDESALKRHEIVKQWPFALKLSLATVEHYLHGFTSSKTKITPREKRNVLQAVECAMPTTKVLKPLI